MNLRLFNNPACRLCTGNWHLDYTSTLTDLHLQSISVRGKYLKLFMIYMIFNRNLFVPDLPICFTNDNNRYKFLYIPFITGNISFHPSTCHLPNDKKLSMYFTSSLLAFKFIVIIYVLYNGSVTSISF